MHDSGTVAQFDQLQVGSGPNTVVVTSVISPTLIEVLANSLNGFPIAADTRLIRTTDRPSVYSDPLGSVSVGNSLSSSATTGRASGYLRETRFDYIVSGTGISPSRIYVDSDQGAREPSPSWLNARDYPSLQATIEAVDPARGAVIFLPAGTYDLTSGLVIDKADITLIGEGRGTIIRRVPPGDFDLITVNRSEFRMYNLWIDGSAIEQDLVNGRCCLVINGLGVSGFNVSHCLLENVLMTNASRYGMWLRDVIFFTAINSEFVSNRGHGARIDSVTTGATTTRIIDSQFSSNDGIGAEIENVSGLTFFGCGFEGNLSQGVPVETGNAIDATSARIELLSCGFEQGQTGGTLDQFVRISTCGAAVVDGCYFYAGTASAFKKGVLFVNSAWSRFSNNVSSKLIDGMVRFDSECQESIEFGNAEIPQAGQQLPIPRILIDGNGIKGPRVISMSRRALGLPRHAVIGTLPQAGAVEPGSLAWVDGPPMLRAWNGAEWVGMARVVKTARFLVGRCR